MEFAIEGINKNEEDTGYSKPIMNIELCGGGKIKIYIWDKYGNQQNPIFFRKLQSNKFKDALNLLIKYM